MSGLRRALAPWAALGLATSGCALPCSDAKCTSSFELVPVDDQGTRASGLHGNIIIGDEKWWVDCRDPISSTVGADCAGHGVIRLGGIGDPEPTRQVELDLLSRDETLRFAGAFDVEWERQYPNGPQCDEGCVVGRLVVTGAELSH